MQYICNLCNSMHGKFISYNFVGGLAWVMIFLMSGFFFGNIPFVKDNFRYVAVGIILVSVVPMGWEMRKGKDNR